MIIWLRDHAARLLPVGRMLPDAVWERRRRLIMRLCLASAGLLVLFAWFRGYGQPAAATVLAAVAGPLVPARMPPSLKPSPSPAGLWAAS